MRYKSLLALLTMVVVPDAMGLDYPFLAYGTHAKGSAGETVVGQLGAMATMSNPANLAPRSERGAYSELSVLSLDYRYERPGFDPAKVEMTLPVPFFGYSGDLGRHLAFGFAGIVAPAAAMQQEIKGVPLALVGPDAALVDIKMGGGDEASYIVGAGLAWRPSRRFALGLGAHHSHVASRLEIWDHQSQTHVVTLDTRVVTTTPVLGVRWRPLSGLVFGAVYEPTSRPRIFTESKSEGGSSRSRRGRRGDELRVGVECGRRLKGFAQVEKANHHLDEGDPLDLGLKESVPDSVDTLGYSLGSRLELGRSGRFTLGYGWYPSPLGDGMMAEHAADGREYAGVAFGRFDALSRNVYGLGYKVPLGRGRAGMALSHHRGRREVDEFSRGYGSYSLEVFHLGIDYSVPL